MNKASLILRGAAVVACALCTASLPALAATQAKQASGPARWYTGDNTKQQRTAVLKKEINAAYAEQQSACKRHSASQRASCLKDARQTYQHDMSRIPQLLAQAPTGEVTERVVTTTTTPAAGGTTSYGGSGAGTTGSGSGNGSMAPQSGQSGDMPSQTPQQPQQTDSVPPQGQ